MKRTIALMVSLPLLSSAAAGAAHRGADVVPFDSGRWNIQATEHRIEEHLGRQSLLLKGGFARLDDVAFTDGIIEFDIAFSDDPGFPGVLWRLQDDGNFEEFYLRPHQSGNPDANQYTPVFNGVTGWQLYYGDGYAAPVEYRFDGWMHVKIVVSGDRAEAYVDSEEPVVMIDDLKRDAHAGAIGVEVSDRAPAWYSNFRYQQLPAPLLRGEPTPPVETPPGTVTRWQVSAPFAEATLDGRTMIAAGDLPASQWSTLAAEPTGITNLARLAGVSEDADTVVARVTLRADREQTVRARFGYSDRVRVYVNGQLTYSGDNGYQTRDYRYLGTIGLFDEVWLPLRRGDNELWFAVSEDFGGWGILCRIDETDGVEIGS